MATLVLMLFLTTYGCLPPSASVKRKPIYENALTLIKLPKKNEKKAYKKGTIVSAEKGDKVPFAGILLTEERAKAAAALRVDYEHLYSTAETNRRFTEVVLRTIGKQLSDADDEVKRLRAQQNSWWARNKVLISVIATAVVTLGLGGLAIWGAQKLEK
jgi:hypothetical protein